MFLFFLLYFALSVLSKISTMCMHYFHNQKEIIQTTDTLGQGRGNDGGRSHWKPKYWSILLGRDYQQWVEFTEEQSWHESISGGGIWVNKGWRQESICGKSSLAKAESLYSFHSFIPSTNIYWAQILDQELCSVLGTWWWSETETVPVLMELLAIK